ncbi:hypothetical protein [uncultured Jatrophihabitans sp.]|uniref:hypothetical protein n=1 Tax=uncultured Jatrophihabitans sp. TaxID=1610747 RepID=UPI0035CB80C4
MKLESLQSRRTWIVGGLAVAILLVAASWLVVIHPKLSSASDTRAVADNNDVQNTQLMAKNSKLAQQQRNIGSLRNGLTAALAALPPTSALPEFTNEVTRSAVAKSVTLTNIGIGALAPVAAAAPVTPTPAATSTSTDPTTSAGAASGAAATTTPAVSQYQINVTLTTSGPLTRQLGFLRAVENGARRALITSTSFSGAGDTTTLTTQLNIFSAPMSADQVAQLRKLLTTAG